MPVKRQRKRQGSLGGSRTDQRNAREDHAVLEQLVMPRASRWFGDAVIAQERQGGSRMPGQSVTPKQIPRWFRKVAINHLVVGNWYGSQVEIAAIWRI
jgi:hypothetical protein